MGICNRASGAKGVAGVGLALLTVAAIGHAARAQEVLISPDMASVAFSANGENFTIAREQDPEAVLSGEFARIARACPPACIQPMKALRNVETVAELEVLSFLQGPVTEGTGLLIDARVPEWFAKGSIPGAVNVPFATLTADNPYRNDILAALGARPTGGEMMDFSDVTELVIFCNGPWSDQSAQAVRALREAGYPADKLKYYRGGMQDWLMLGLTATAPIQLAGGQP